MKLKRLTRADLLYISESTRVKKAPFTRPKGALDPRVEKELVNMRKQLAVEFEAYQQKFRADERHTQSNFQFVYTRKEGSTVPMYELHTSFYEELEVAFGETPYTWSEDKMVYEIFVAVPTDAEVKFARIHLTKWGLYD
jgi:hypothetical protein